MRHHVSWHIPWILWVAIAAALLLLLAPRNAHGQPVTYSVNTHRGGDTLYVGENTYISFDVDGHGALIVGMVFPLDFSFGAGSLMGSMSDKVYLEFNPLFSSINPPPCCVVGDSLMGTDPDTLLVGIVVFGGPWITSGPEWAFRASFKPLAPGQIRIDSITLPPANHLAALNPLGEELQLEWSAPLFAVLPCPNVLGDVNQNGTVTSGDIILFVKCVFACDFGGFDILELGDVDCNGQPTVADVIHMVNYVFKGMPLPFCCIVLD
jgi:hypothetical protein